MATNSINFENLTEKTANLSINPCLDEVDYAGHNPISYLKEFSDQKKNNCTLYEFYDIKKSGADHALQFTISCKINYNGTISETKNKRGT